jgi:hypothetical protein
MVTKINPTMYRFNMKNSNKIYEIENGFCPFLCSPLKLDKMVG